MNQGADTLQKYFFSSARDSSKAVHLKTFQKKKKVPYSNRKESRSSCYGSRNATNVYALIYIGCFTMCQALISMLETHSGVRHILSFIMREHLCRAYNMPHTAQEVRHDLQLHGAHTVVEQMSDKLQPHRSVHASPVRVSLRARWSTLRKEHLAGLRGNREQGCSDTVSGKKRAERSTGINDGWMER